MSKIFDEFRNWKPEGEALADRGEINVWEAPGTPGNNVAEFFAFLLWKIERLEKRNRAQDRAVLENCAEDMLSPTSPIMLRGRFRDKDGNFIHESVGGLSEQIPTEPAQMFCGRCNGYFPEGSKCPCYEEDKE